MNPIRASKVEIEYRVECATSQAETVTPSRPIGVVFVIVSRMSHIEEEGIGIPWPVVAHVQRGIDDGPVGECAVSGWVGEAPTQAAIIPDVLRRAAFEADFGRSLGAD